MRWVRSEAEVGADGFFQAHQLAWAEPAASAPQPGFVDRMQVCGVDEADVVARETRFAVQGYVDLGRSRDPSRGHAGGASAGPPLPALMVPQGPGRRRRVLRVRERSRRRFLPAWSQFRSPLAVRCAGDQRVSSLASWRVLSGARRPSRAGKVPQPCIEFVIQLLAVKRRHWLLTRDILDRTRG
jgi:hypothetical protein